MDLNLHAVPLFVLIRSITSTKPLVVPIGEITLNNGSLGSCIDEERSELR